MLAALGSNYLGNGSHEGQSQSEKGGELHFDRFDSGDDEWRLDE